MEVDSKSKLDFIQALLIARKCSERNPLCGLCIGPCQASVCRYVFRKLGPRPTENGAVLGDSSLAGHGFLRSFRKAPEERQ